MDVDYEPPTPPPAPCNARDNDSLFSGHANGTGLGAGAAAIFDQLCPSTSSSSRVAVGSLVEGVVTKGDDGQAPSPARRRLNHNEPSKDGGVDTAATLSIDDRGSIANSEDLIEGTSSSGKRDKSSVYRGPAYAKEAAPVESLKITVENTHSEASLEYQPPDTFEFGIPLPSVHDGHSETGGVV